MLSCYKSQSQFQGETDTNDSQNEAPKICTHEVTRGPRRICVSQFQVFSYPYQCTSKGEVDTWGKASCCNMKFNSGMHLNQQFSFWFSNIKVPPYFYQWKHSTPCNTFIACIFPYTCTKPQQYICSPTLFPWGAMSLGWFHTTNNRI